MVTPSRRTSSGSRGSAIGDAVLHQHLRLVEIGAEPERDRQRHRAVGRALRRHVEHVFDAVDLLLDRRGDGVGDDLGRRARIRCADDDRRRHDVGILRGRQREIGDRAEDHDDDRQHGREDRTVDEEMDDSHAVVLKAGEPGLRRVFGGSRSGCRDYGRRSVSGTSIGSGGSFCGAPPSRFNCAELREIHSFSGTGT